MTEKGGNLVQTTFVWKPIEDLPLNWMALASTELEGLARIWKSQARKFQESDALKKFYEQLSREWAIETGIIENLYSIDRDTTQLLIEKGIETTLIPYGTTDQPAERIVPVLIDQQEALESLFSFVAQKRELSIFYIRELHQIFTQHQETVDAVDAFGHKVQVPLLHGQWKQKPNNPTLRDGKVHEYSPPLQVQSEMERLVSMHLEDTKQGVPPELEAAWLHHRFTQIHPFQDGNGRVARALASFIFIKAGWFPLVISRDFRDEYLDGLQEADKGNLFNLVNLFAKLQKKAFVKVLSLSENVLNDGEPLKKVILAGIERLKARKEQQTQQMQSQAFELAEKLEDIAEAKFGLVALELNHELKSLEEVYFADVQRSDKNNDYWYRQQIIQIAIALQYYADTRTYRSWVRLKIKEDRQTEIILSFHALGFEFFGIMAASAFIEYRDKTEEQEVTFLQPRVLCSEVFQFSYTEKEDFVIQRFDPWLEDVLLVGLDQWRKQL
ncbi:Fic family protein [Scytonema sp. UIC 10036]|uniref:Fic family protein n=1 Tax=Scytonema sp. UIC 10036 TaxID=2304196 RepID=UPI0012DA266F|nr:Fic family protein [Scytonema sp. UIC 10036]MUG93263.1 Fic family protein [Scytonema sp. UIC 10036]